MPSFDGLTNTLACVHARCIAPKPLRAEFLEASTSVIMVARSVAPLLYGVPVSGALRSECVASRAAPIAQNVVMLGNKKEGERVSQRPRERGSCECTLKLAHNVLLQKVALIHNERLKDGFCPVTSHSRATEVDESRDAIAHAFSLFYGRSLSHASWSFHPGTAP